jgi:hypothetical protein
MRHSIKTLTETETRVLGTLALACYATTLAAMLVFGYSLLALSLRSAVFNEMGLYSSNFF